MRSYVGKIRRFLRREEGVVSVEWIALASALVVGAIVVGVSVTDNAAGVAGTIPGDISTTTDTATGNAANFTGYVP